jgi:ubiquinone/menaquinone biosynthesis C-methylase UbiE/uncharacterized protein YbaR (Trm112 family)
MKTETLVDEALLRIIRCPVTGARLRLRDEVLEGGGREYPVRDGIPILLQDVHQRRWQDPRPVAAPEQQIMDAFEDRSASYFSDNYLSTSPASRDRRRRHELVVGLLRGVIASEAAVLEAGSGPAVLAGEITALGGKYVAADLSYHNLIAARERLGSVRGVVGNVTALPFASESFDVVTAIGCLEYVPAMGLAVNELSRVCRKGGVIIASFANRNSPRRWWEELLVHRIARIKARRSGGASVYRRFLVSPATVHRIFEAAGAPVRDEQPLNGGFVGFPLSGFRIVQSAEAALQARSSRARLASSEFVVVAERRA